MMSAPSICRMHFPVAIHCIIINLYSGKEIFINEACLASFTAFETGGDSPRASDAILINATSEASGIRC